MKSKQIKSYEGNHRIASYRIIEIEWKAMSSTYNMHIESINPYQRVSSVLVLRWQYQPWRSLPAVYHSHLQSWSQYWRSFSSLQGGLFRREKVNASWFRYVPGKWSRFLPDGIKRTGIPSDQICYVSRQDSLRWLTRFAALVDKVSDVAALQSINQVAISCYLRWGFWRRAQFLLQPSLQLTLHAHTTWVPLNNL